MNDRQLAALINVLEQAEDQRTIVNRRTITENHRGELTVVVLAVDR